MIIVAQFARRDEMCAKEMLWINIDHVRALNEAFQGMIQKISLTHTPGPSLHIRAHIFATLRNRIRREFGRKKFSRLHPFFHAVILDH